MKAAGMFLGSFYGYFGSKEQLVAETSAKAVSSTTILINHYLANKKVGALSRLVHGYLSPGHRDNLSEGCGLAALGNEMTHQPESVRQGITEEVRVLISETEKHLHGRTKAAREDSSIALAASLIGGLILSRAITDSQLSDRILKAVSESIKQSNQPADAAQQKETHHGETRR